MKIARFQILLVAMLATASAYGQSRYCCSYEDFVSDKWERLDTVYCDQHSKSRQLWWGGNDFTLSTGDKALDKTLKKKAFIVMQGDTMYINCRNLRFEKTRFGNGYTRAMRIGNRSILFVNRMIGSDAASAVGTSSAIFGIIGGMVASNTYMKQQVCYVISSGADEKGRIVIRIVDDALVNQMLVERDDIREEYYAEPDDAKRVLAARLVPLLEKAGLFKKNVPTTHN